MESCSEFRPMSKLSADAGGIWNAVVAVLLVERSTGCDRSTLANLPKGHGRYSRDLLVVIMNKNPLSRMNR